MLSEAMLACAGVINRMGSIAAGTTVSDYHDNEQQRQISVSASLMHCEWLGKKFNIIDCPGYADFISEGLGALRVGDFALVVVHANHGVGVGTDAVWRYATEDGIPKMLVVNAFDKEETDFEKTLAQIREHFGERVFPLTIPINAGPGFNQVLDVPRNEIITYATDKSGKFTEAPATGALADRVKELHNQLIEFIAESDDALMEKYFAEGGLSEEEWRGGIHTAIQKQVFTPLFVTSAETNIGVARLMDFIAKYGSSPADRAKLTAHDVDGKEVDVNLNDPDPVCYVFKTMSEAQFGELSFFRIYSGSVKFGSDLHNTTRRTSEKIGQIYVLNGKTRTSVPCLNAGDIGAVVKLKDTHTGNTLCGGKRPVALPKVDYPKPNIHASLKSAVKGEEDKIASGLAALHHEDPTFLHLVDSELRQTILSAQGELHLEVIADKLAQALQRPCGPLRTARALPGDDQRPWRGQIPAQETNRRRRAVCRSLDADRTQAARHRRGIHPIALRAKRGPDVRALGRERRDEGLRRRNPRGLPGGGCEDRLLRRQNAPGGLEGYRLPDRGLFRVQGIVQHGPAVPAGTHSSWSTIRIPEDCMGKVMGDLSSRRGKIQGMDMEGSFQLIKAHVPAKELYRYSSTLRSLTGGRGVHAEEFSHYEEMPREAEAKVIEESKKHRTHQAHEE